MEILIFFMPTFFTKSGKSAKDASHSSISQNESQTNEHKFKVEEPKWKWNEVILDSKVKEAIDDAILFCDKKDELVKQYELDNFLKGASSIGINLYGESGTGKSITAEAIANELRRKIIKVDYSEIQDSKWGATEKNLTQLFKVAEQEGAVIFLDEADGLLSKRSTTVSSTSEASNGIKAHLLTLIDRSNVIIIYATNLFRNFDSAFYRRILFHINYPMPKAIELEKLWKFHIDKLPKDEHNFSYEAIARDSEGVIAGGDIKNITMRLCVKLAANKINAITNECVKEEIVRTQRSKLDSLGISKEPSPNSIGIMADIDQTIKQE